MRDGDKQDERRSAEITPLSRRDAPTGRSILEELEDHWRELKAASMHLPRRADLDASRIVGALPHSFILERAPSGAPRFRVAGGSVAGLVGGETQGIPLSVLFARSSRAGLKLWTDRCFEEPALVDLMVEASEGALRPRLRGRLLLLPMLDNEGQVTRALAGLLMEGVPRRGNLCFELSDAVPRVEALAPAAAPRRAFGASPITTKRPGLQETQRPYLRLVVSNP
jgi:hypothetical protein